MHLKQSGLSANTNRIEVEDIEDEGAHLGWNWGYTLSMCMENGKRLFDLRTLPGCCGILVLYNFRVGLLSELTPEELQTVKVLLLPLGFGVWTFTYYKQDINSVLRPLADVLGGVVSSRDFKNPRTANTQLTLWSGNFVENL